MGVPERWIGWCGRNGNARTSDNPTIDRIGAGEPLCFGKVRSNIAVRQRPAVHVHHTLNTRTTQRGCGGNDEHTRGGSECTNLSHPVAPQGAVDLVSAHGADCTKSLDSLLLGQSPATEVDDVDHVDGSRPGLRPNGHRSTSRRQLGSHLECTGAIVGRDQLARPLPFLRHRFDTFRQ